MLIKKILSVFLLVLHTQVLALSQPILCDGKQILGKAEKIILLDKNFYLAAKLDTGATMSSLSASGIKTFKKNKQTWVRFTVLDTKTKTKVMFEKPLIRYVHIRKRKDENNQKDKQFAPRPVVSFLICMGRQKKPIFVNLIDRTQFNYTMLLGNAALKKFHVLVDVSQEYLSEPACQ